MKENRKLYNELVIAINDKEVSIQLKESVMKVKNCEPPLSESKAAINKAINNLMSVKGNKRNNKCHTFHEDNNRKYKKSREVTACLQQENHLTPNEVGCVNEDMEHKISVKSQKLKVMPEPPKPPKRGVVTYNSPHKRGKKLSSRRAIFTR